MLNTTKVLKWLALLMTGLSIILVSIFAIDGDWLMSLKWIFLAVLNYMCYRLVCSTITHQSKTDARVQAIIDDIRSSGLNQ